MSVPSTAPVQESAAGDTGRAGSESMSTDGVQLPSTVLSPDPATVPRPAGSGVTQQITASVVAPPGPGTGAMGSIQQTLTVSVRPGGPVRVTPTQVTVVLHRSGARLVGELGPVVLEDPRGTLGGWSLVAHLTGRTDSSGIGAPMLVPGAPIAVTGRPSEVRSALPRRLGRSGTVLMAAPPGGGGGSFSVDGTIVLPAGPNTVAGSVELVIVAAPPLPGA